MPLSSFLNVVTIFAATTTATSISHQVIPRQNDTCASSGQVDCGTDTCIPASYTCCPNNISGCDTESAYCYPVDGSYGCCAIGFTCGSDVGNTTLSSIEPSIISTSISMQTLTPYVYHPSTTVGASSTMTAASTPSSTSTTTNGGYKVGSGGGRLSWVAAVLLGVLAT